MSGINKTPDESSFVGGRGDASGVELSNVLDSIENQNTGSTPEGKETILSLVSEIQELANLTSLQNLSGTLPTATTEEEQKDSTEAEDILQVFPEEKDTFTEEPAEAPLEPTPTSMVSYYTNKLKKIGVTGTALATLLAACAPNPNTPGNPYWTQPTSPYSAPVTPGAPFSPSSSAQNFNNTPETGRIVAENQYIRVREVKRTSSTENDLTVQPDSRITSINSYTGAITVESNGIVEVYSLSKDITSKKDRKGRPLIPDDVIIKENTAYVTFLSSGVLAKVDLISKKWDILRDNSAGEFSTPELSNNGQILSANIGEGTVINLVDMKTVLQPKEKYIVDLEILPNGTIATLHGQHNGPQGPGPVSVLIGDKKISVQGTYPRTLVGNAQYLAIECVGDPIVRKLPSVITIIELATLKPYTIFPPKGSGTNGLGMDSNKNTIGFTFSTINSAKAPGITTFIPLNPIIGVMEKENISSADWNKLLPTGIPTIIAEDTTRITVGTHTLGTQMLNGPSKLYNIEQK